MIDNDNQMSINNDNYFFKDVKCFHYHFLIRFSQLCEIGKADATPSASVLQAQDY